MKIVTFNLRFDTPNDGEFAFSYRKEEVIRRIQMEKPDIVGFQEMRDEMQVYMEDHMPGYYWVGHGRTAELGGEYCPIAFRKDKFKMRAFECFWLSDTPNVPGSRFAVQGSHPRVCNVITLYSIEDKKSFRVWNLHLDNATMEGRRDGLKVVVEKSLAVNAVEKLPNFIIGDFNAEPGWEEMKAIESVSEYTDVTAHILHTFHDYYRNERLEKIDYIYIDEKIKAISCNIWDTEEGHICLSDHFPIELVCELV
jgi:endonuclease/exonuclease/phosphatase family metal-dependent hydrolase